MTDDGLRAVHDLRLRGVEGRAVGVVVEVAAGVRQLGVGQQALQRPRLGSLAQHYLHKAPCDIFVVR